MGRSRTFDEAVAVRAARAVFWRDGYDAASLPELEAATGLSRSSLYHAFGSKRGLFDAAVDSYLDEIVRPRLRPLTTAVVALDALDVYLTGLRDALLRPDISADGCLLVNSATAPIGRDEIIAERVTAYRAELRAAIGRGVDAAVAVRAGAVRADADARARLADACTGLVIAAFAMARVDPAQAGASLDAARALLTDAH